MIYLFNQIIITQQIYKSFLDFLSATCVNEDTSEKLGVFLKDNPNKKISWSNFLNGINQYLKDINENQELEVIYLLL